MESRAWMGVPLNAGAETIGAVSVASRDPATAYTSGHVALLQAVADQATGAIVKARLLQESQERARQLSQLNDIARRLTSTLELEPLLQSIVEGSISVLGCEACVLYLVDEPATGFVIRATAGTMARAALGRRLPIGTRNGRPRRRPPASRFSIIRCSRKLDDSPGRTRSRIRDSDQSCRAASDPGAKRRRACR